VITTIVTFLTEKIVAVVITIVVVVAAVPTLIVAIHGDTITITTGPVASISRQGNNEERARLILEVKTAGDNVVLQVTNEEVSCDSQINQLSSLSKLTPAATAAALDRGKSRIHDAALPYLKQIKAEQDEFEHLSLVTVASTQTYLVRIANIQVMALGEDGRSGLLISACQTILVEIRQIIVIVVVAPGGHDIDDDIRTPR
jgi:cell division protein FtsL